MTAYSDEVVALGGQLAIDGGTDATGNGHDVTLVGGAAVVSSGGPGPSLASYLDLDGVDDHGYITDAAALDLFTGDDGSHVVWLWMPASNNSDDWACAFAKGDGGGYELRHATDATKPGRLNWSPRASLSAADLSPFTGEWVMYAGTKAGSGSSSQGKLFRRRTADSSVVEVGTNTDALMDYPEDTHSGNLFFGARGGTARYFHGRVTGYAHFKNVVLTTAQMDSLWDAALEEVAGDPPGQVVGLTGTADGNAVDLAWTATATATSYTVERERWDGTAWVEPATAATGVTTTSYRDAGLAETMLYRHRVTAVNAGGSGTPSAWDETTTGLAPVLPTLPVTPTHWWRFDEGAGTSVGDIEGSAALTLSSSAVWANVGADGEPVATVSAAQDGTASSVTYPTGSLWVAACVRTDIGTFAGSPVKWSADGFDVALSASGIRLFVGGAAVIALNSPRAWQLWLVIQVWRDGTTWGLRVNGRTVTATATATAGTGGIVVGDGTAGRVGDVIVWDGTAPTAGQRDDVYEALRPRFYGPRPTLDTAGAALTPTVTDGPWQGELFSSQMTGYTQVSSTPTHTFVGASVDQTGKRSRVARIVRVSGSVSGQTPDQDVNLGSVDSDSNQGHQGVSVGAHETVGVFAHPQQHGETFSGRHNTSRDLTALSVSDFPAALTSDLFYHSFYVDPAGDVYFLARMTGANRTLAALKWNKATSEWDVLGALPIADYTQNTGIHPTQQAMAFHDGTMFLHPSGFRGLASGFRRDIGAVKSVDGTTWTNLAGGAVTLPITELDLSLAFPHTLPDVTADDDAHDSTRSHVGVFGDGTPFIVGPWRNWLEGQSGFAFWFARWDATSGTFLPQIVNASSHSGITYILSGDGSRLVVLEALSTGTDQYAWVTDDQGDSWTRHLLAAGTEEIGTWHADVRSHELDGRWRALGARSKSAVDPSRWEFYEWNFPDEGVAHTRTIRSTTVGTLS